MAEELKDAVEAAEAALEDAKRNRDITPVESPMRTVTARAVFQAELRLKHAKALLAAQVAGPGPHPTAPTRAPQLPKLLPSPWSLLIVAVVDSVPEGGHRFVAWASRSLFTGRYYPAVQA